MQPTNSNSDYETHLAARQWHWWSAVGAQGDRGKGARAGTVVAITINHQVWESFVVETGIAA